MNLSFLSPYQWKNQRIKAINEKTEDQSYSYGCIMGYFDPTADSDLTEIEVADDDVYDNEEKEYGREIEPHVTILYGLHDDEIEEDEVIELLKSLKLPTVNFSQVTSFDNEKFDVLKWDVESDQLNLYNKIVTLMFPFTSKFPDYHAHCTIAYLKPGTAKKYYDKEKVKSEIHVPIWKWVYSKADGKKISVDAEGNVEVMREAEDKKGKVEENLKYNLYFDKSTNKVTEYKSQKEDESYEYKGYQVELHQNKRFIGEDGNHSYSCRVLKDGEYKMGLRGPGPLHKCKEAAELFINGQTK